MKSSIVLLDRERKLGRDDLVLRLYYITSDTLEKSEMRAASGHAQAIHAHQYRDWRHLRSRSPGSEKVRKQIEALAQELKDALDRTSSIQIQSKGDVSPPISNIATSADRPTESVQPLKGRPLEETVAEHDKTAADADAECKKSRLWTERDRGEPLGSSSTKTHAPILEIYDVPRNYRLLHRIRSLVFVLFYIFITFNFLSLRVTEVTYDRLLQYLLRF